ncbi:hypothetical protein QP157_01940 [Sphingomonas sp. LR61]
MRTPLADVHVDERQLDAGVRAHPGEDPGQQQFGRRREDREVDAARRAAQVLLPGGVDPGDRRGDAGRQSGEYVAVGGEPDAAADALDERDAHLPLQRLQLLRHRAGRAVRGLGDGGDAAALGEFAQDGEQVHVEVDHAGRLQRRLRTIRWSYTFRATTIGA